MTAVTKLSWKPERYGDTYCSSACGGRCTWAAYKKAGKRAKKLAKRLGEGWTTRVSENLGWHYSVISPCERLKVREHRYQGKVESYSAFLGEPGPGGRYAVSADTPEAAIKKVLKVAKAEVAAISALVEGL